MHLLMTVICLGLSVLRRYKDLEGHFKYKFPVVPDSFNASTYPDKSIPQADGSTLRNVSVPHVYHTSLPNTCISLLIINYQDPPYDCTANVRYNVSLFFDKLLEYYLCLWNTSNGLVLPWFTHFTILVV